MSDNNGESVFFFNKFNMIIANDDSKYDVKEHSRYSRYRKRKRLIKANNKKIQNNYCNNYSNGNKNNNIINSNSSGANTKSANKLDLDLLESMFCNEAEENNYIIVDEQETKNYIYANTNADADANNSKTISKLQEILNYTDYNNSIQYRIYLLNNYLELYIKGKGEISLLYGEIVVGYERLTNNNDDFTSFLSKLVDFSNKCNNKENDLNYSDSSMNYNIGLPNSLSSDGNDKVIKYINQLADHLRNSIIETKLNKNNCNNKINSSCNGNVTTTFDTHIEEIDISINREIELLLYDFKENLSKLLSNSNNSNISLVLIKTDLLSDNLILYSLNNDCGKINKEINSNIIKYDYGKSLIINDIDMNIENKNKNKAISFDFISSDYSNIYQCYCNKIINNSRIEIIDNKKKEKFIVINLESSKENKMFSTIKDSLFALELDLINDINLSVINIDNINTTSSSFIWDIINHSYKDIDLMMLLLNNKNKSCKDNENCNSKRFVRRTVLPYKSNTINLEVLVIKEFLINAIQDYLRENIFHKTVIIDSNDLKAINKDEESGYISSGMIRFLILLPKIDSKLQEFLFESVIRLFSFQNTINNHNYSNTDSNDYGINSKYLTYYLFFNHHYLINEKKNDIHIESKYFNNILLKKYLKQHTIKYTIYDNKDQENYFDKHNHKKNKKSSNKLDTCLTTKHKHRDVLDYRNLLIKINLKEEEKNDNKDILNKKETTILHTLHDDTNVITLNNSFKLLFLVNNENKINLFYEENSNINNQIELLSRLFDSNNCELSIKNGINTKVNSNSICNYNEVDKNTNYVVKFIKNNYAIKTYSIYNNINFISYIDLKIINNEALIMINSIPSFIYNEIKQFFKDMNNKENEVIELVINKDLNNNHLSYNPLNKKTFLDSFNIKHNSNRRISNNPSINKDPSHMNNDDILNNSNSKIWSSPFLSSLYSKEYYTSEKLSLINLK